MTIAILSADRISTSGLAPLLSATRRFWMSADNLKRPPTLLTIVSSLNSSCTAGPSTTNENFTNFLYCAIQIVVHDLIVIFRSVVQFPPRRGQPTLDFLLTVGSAPSNSPLVLVQRTRLEKDHQAIGIHLLDRHPPLHIDLQQNRAAFAASLLDRLSR